MNIERFRKQLLKAEKTLSDQIERHVQHGRDQTDEDDVRDVGDESVAEEAASVQFTEAEINSTVLQQVRDALQRIDDHTFGRCVVDGEPIEEKRLEAMPWTPYCLKHQESMEAAEQKEYPTL
jgi:DnaK suppressor protein